ncbi:MAG TPA: OB-fold domain-containing protein [Ramlibacter sp.]|uniref:Zn-ribbon domain-containing OB-fold protein n=1 Tax=Ramlibacter sp. TaxID=1917967 RepID=UPI002D085E50|nr:OB-fold domain-containing protein [Ramlibacter sp.]HVZ44925.1 OB-fold domain-containing protein [Ramlibacter sp.]
MNTDPSKPLPDPDGENGPFWEGASRGEVRVQRCTGCGLLRFPACRYCSRCLGEKSEWVRTNGRGEVETFCIFHRAYFPSFAADIPYNVALVRLEEGPKMFTNLVGLAREELRIGMKVRAVFERVSEAAALVKFERDAGG